MELFFCGEKLGSLRDLYPIDKIFHKGTNFFFLSGVLLLPLEIPALFEGFSFQVGNCLRSIFGAVEIFFCSLDVFQL